MLDKQEKKGSTPTVVPGAALPWQVLGRVGGYLGSFSLQTPPESRRLEVEGRWAAPARREFVMATSGWVRTEKSLIWGGSKFTPMVNVDKKTMV